MTPGLLDEVAVGRSTVRNRVLFGPHATNLCDGRSISARHVAYYERRAIGGCGTIVTEVASVHPSDWPYERAPLATDCAPGWAAVAEACHAHGAVVLAGLGHAGLQGSTAYSQDVLWAPSLVPNVLTHEQPVAIGPSELAELVRGFADAAGAAVAAGSDGVEVNAGQHSLLRQFCSGLTNQRADDYGATRSKLLTEVLVAIRGAIGDAILGVRYCLDELAPWAGLTPPLAGELLCEVVEHLDYACLVRGSIYSEAATQPDGHVEQDCNREATAIVADVLAAKGRGVVLCAQGSIVDVSVAQGVVEAGRCALVEMTRAQIADPDLCAKLAAEPARIRPCVLCNQHCMVRDPRNPIVSCSVNPVAGHELDDGALDDHVRSDATPDPVERARGDRPIALVVGAGVAGLEASRVLAARGHRVTLRERTGITGGALRTAARLPGRGRLVALIEWLDAEVARAGVTVELDADVEPSELASWTATIVACGGGVAPLTLRDGSDGTITVLDAAQFAEVTTLDAGPVVVLDPIGGPIGVAAAELAASLGAATSLVTPDMVAGTQLAATGDLVAANGRLAAAGVAILTHSRAVGIRAGTVVLEDTFTAATTSLEARYVVDAGHRVPSPTEWPTTAHVIGDAVAPRGMLSAVLEARRAAASVLAGAP